MFTSTISTIALTAALGTGAAALQAPTPSDDPSPTTTSSRSDDALRTVLQRDARALRSEWKVPGLLVDVRTPHGDVRVRAGRADVRTGRPMPWRAHVRIASFTKTFVSATVLQLVDEGRLRLDEPVDTYLPGLIEGHGNDGHRITVRMLLQHTSGLADYLAYLPVFTKAGFREHRFDTLTGRQAVRLAVAHAPHFAPGARWEYSNTNYAVAGLLIKAVTGTSWRQQVRQRIIEPLHLTHTSIPYTSSRLPRPHARGYERFLKAGSDPEHPTFTSPIDATALNPSWAGAAGSIVSTTADGNTFLRALVSGKVLSPRMLREMQTTVPISKEYQVAWPGARYGLGIFWIPNRCGGFWAHGGDIMGSMTRNGVTDDGRRSVVVNYNTDSPVSRTGHRLPTLDLSTKIIDDALCG